VTKPQPSLSVRTVAKMLKKLKVNQGDLLILKRSAFNADIFNDMLSLIRKGIEYMNIKVLVILVDDFDDIKAIGEKEMNTYGWYRLGSLLKLIGKTPVLDAVKKASVEHEDKPGIGG